MAIPPALASTRDLAWQRLGDQLDPALFSSLQEVLKKKQVFDAFEQVITTSDFFLDQVLKQPHWVQASIENNCLFGAATMSAEDFQQELAETLESASDEPAVMAGLRCFRNRQMLRLVAREFSGVADLDETLSGLSNLADTAIRYAVSWATSYWESRYGNPVGEWSKAPQELVVLGMGKLGGSELNLSSDIDLIFLYPEAGSTTGKKKSISNQEFFIRVGQSVIKLLDAQTAQGFCFRVDMRLRPFGSSGALVTNYNALEHYLQEHGREWERYAMVKARAITGSTEAVAPLEDMLRAFVYRRYTDFGVIDSLRSLKKTIEAETRRLQLQDNIKRGAGGIREVEFIVQCKQLIHGGRNTPLQTRSLKCALDALLNLDLISREDRDGLDSGYRFLRRLENALQGIADEQTQTLPAEEINQSRLACLMGVRDWTELLAEIDRQRHEISHYFSELVNLGENESTPALPSLRWDELSEDSLRERGFQEPKSTWNALQGLMESTRVLMLQNDGRKRLEQFLPQLIDAAVSTEWPDTGLVRTLPFVNAVLRRSAYLVLMNENPAALRQLVWLNGASPWIASKLERRPELVEELLHEERLYSAPNREEMATLVREQLLRIPQDDLEQQMQVMATIKDGVVLRVAASELTGRLDIMKASDNLTFLAEVIIQHAIDVAKSEMVSRHGEPGGNTAGFAVMGYGKLGGIELGYGSDLDLVFVFDGADGETSGPRQIDNSRFFARLAQRVVHILGTNVASGQLYEVDMRLRPNGQSGLPCVTYEGFLRYQEESAWTWEHQALVRARPVAGDQALCEALGEARLAVLRQERDLAQLLEDVVSMRQRMFHEGESRIGGAADQFDLKRDPGGIVDIEFIVQYLVLKAASKYPELAKDTDVVNLLASLVGHGILSDDQGEKLKLAYLAYRAHVHRAVLTGAEPLGHIDKFKETLITVIAIRNEILPELPALSGLADSSLAEN